MSRKLLADSAIYTVANFIARLASLGTLAVLPLMLDIGEYGVVGLVAATGALVNILLPLEVSQGLARFYASTPEETRSKLAGTAWWFTFAMLTGAAVLGFLLAKPFSALLFEMAKLHTVFLLAIGFWWGNCAFIFLQNQLRWSFRAREYATYSLIYAAALLSGAIAFAAWAPDPLEGAIGGWALGALMVAAFAFLTLRESLTFGISRVHLRLMLRYALPLVPASVAVLMTTYVGRLILGSKVGLSEVGLFTFVSQVAAIPSLLILGLQSAVTPHVMASFDNPSTPALLARIFEVVLIAGLAGSTALALLCDAILPIIGYAAYSGIGDLVLFLGPALLFQQLYIFAPGFAIAQRTGLQAVVSILSGVMALVLNLVLITYLGALGAAFATFLAAFLFISVWFVLAQRYYPVPVRWRPLLAITGGFAAASQGGMLAPDKWEFALPLMALILVLAAAAPIWFPSIRTFARELR